MGTDARAQSPSPTSGCGAAGASFLRLRPRLRENAPAAACMDMYRLPPAGIRHMYPLINSTRTRNVLGTFTVRAAIALSLFVWRIRGALAFSRRYTAVRQQLRPGASASTTSSFVKAAVQAPEIATSLVVQTVIRSIAGRTKQCVTVTGNGRALVKFNARNKRTIQALSLSPFSCKFKCTQ